VEESRITALNLTTNSFLVPKFPNTHFPCNTSLGSLEQSLRMRQFPW